MQPNQQHAVEISSSQTKDDLYFKLENLGDIYYTANQLRHRDIPKDNMFVHLNPTLVSMYSRCISYRFTIVSARRA